MESEVGNTSSHSVENSPWKGLWDLRVWELVIAFLRREMMQHK